MSVYRTKSGLWTYDFWFQGRRYYPAASVDTKDEATEAESSHKRLLRRRAAGLETLAPEHTPRFSDWASVTLRFQRHRKEIKAPEAAKTTLRMVLAFWGTKPKTKPVKDGPYHDYRLGDAIQRPELILDFEEWMTARGLSGARKNHYRSACSMMYRVAMMPEHRSRSGIRSNPFAGIMRDRVRRRTRIVTPADISRWIGVAPAAVVAAVTIGTLAPALRLRNVVELRWRDFSADGAFLTVGHKADRDSGPLTIAVSASLQEVLAQLREQRPLDPFVVPIDLERPSRRTRKPVDRTSEYWHLVKLLKRSIADAGLPYGRRRSDGVTFHTLRHSMNTWMARRKEITPSERQRSMGHKTHAMQQWYEHLAGTDTIAAMELLGSLPLGSEAVARLKSLESPGKVPADRRKATDLPGLHRRKRLKIG